MATVKFYSGTLAKYNALTSKDSNALYIIEDAGAIYKGTTNVTSDVSFLTAVPTELKANKIAIVSVTANNKTMYDMYIGNSSNVPVKVQPGTVDDSSAFSNESTYGGYTATVSAIKKFVNDSVADATQGASKAFINASFATNTGKLTFEPIGSSETDVTVDLTNVAHGITWDSTNFKLTIPQYGADKDLEINIPKDFFLKSGEYVESHTFDDKTTGPAIHLVVNIADGSETDKDIWIPVGELVDTYTVGNTDTVTLAMDAAHNITAAVKFDTTALTGTEKILVKTSKGLAQSGKSLNDIDTAITAVDTKVDTLTEKVNPAFGTADMVVVSTATGIKKSSAKIGGSTFKTTTDANTLATEKATETAITNAISWNAL